MTKSLCAKLPIPNELKCRQRWCCWQLNGKQSKAPVQSGGTGFASSTEPRSWSAFDDAWGFYTAKNTAAQGLNFATGGNDGDQLVAAGFDLDNVVDDQGIVDPRVERIVKQLQTYAEFSPSGKGIRIWVLAPKSCKNISDPRRGFEFYAAKHFLSVTGNSNLGMPRSLAQIDAETPQSLYEQFIAESPQHSSAESADASASSGAPTNVHAAKSRKFVDNAEDMTRDTRQLVDVAKRCVDRLLDDRADDYGQWIGVLAALKWVESHTGCDLSGTWHAFSQRCQAK